MNKPRYDKALFKALGQAVSIRRLRLQHSVDELGQRAGLSPAYVKEIETGLRNVNLGTLSKVCRGLNCTLSELFREAECLLPEDARDTLESDS